MVLTGILARDAACKKVLRFSTYKLPLPLAGKVRQNLRLAKLKQDVVGNGAEITAVCDTYTYQPEKETPQGLKLNVVSRQKKKQNIRRGQSGCVIGSNAHPAYQS